MKEITRLEAKQRNLRFMGNVIGKNLSQTVLMLERFKESKKGYYSVDLIALNEETHNGQIMISFWL